MGRAFGDVGSVVGDDQELAQDRRSPVKKIRTPSCQEADVKTGSESYMNGLIDFNQKHSKINQTSKSVVKRDRPGVPE